MSLHQRCPLRSGHVEDGVGPRDFPGGIDKTTLVQPGDDSPRDYRRQSGCHLFRHMHLARLPWLVTRWSSGRLSLRLKPSLTTSLRPRHTSRYVEKEPAHTFGEQQGVFQYQDSPPTKFVILREHSEPCPRLPERRTSFSSGHASSRPARVRSLRQGRRDGS